MLRWEYQPGSALFVIWSQGREERIKGLGEFQFSRDYNDLFTAPASSVFLVKFSKWFNF